MKRRSENRVSNLKLAVCFVLLIGGVIMSAEAKSEDRAQLYVNLDRVCFEDFLGVNAVYQAFAWMPESKIKGYTEADIQRELDRIKRMELKVARTWYRPGWAVGEGTIAGPFDWESERMQAFYKWLTAMKEMNVDVALQAGWGFPADTHTGREYADPDKDPAEYATWVSESVNQLVNVRGFDNIKYLILMTEPTTSPWAKHPEDEKLWPKYVQVKRDDGPIENLELWPYYVKVMRTLDEKMKADKTRGLVKFVGPNNHAVNAFKYLRLEESVEELADVLDIYGAHSYLPPENAYEGWKSFMDKVSKVLSSNPKPIWLDEYNVQKEWKDHVRDQPAHGTYIAELIAASLDAKIQNTLIWSLFDQQYPSGLDVAEGGNSFYYGVHRWGTVRFPYDSQENPKDPYPVWYAFSMLSKYLGGGVGTKVYECKGEDDIRINAIRQNDGTWRFLVINSNRVAKLFEIQLSRDLSVKLERHLYDPAELEINEDAAIPGIDKTFQNVSNSIFDTLPAGAVAVYVGSF